ncbi:hypothetical protein ACJX0J_007669, partial [Zea mays]
VEIEKRLNVSYLLSATEREEKKGERKTQDYGGKLPTIHTKTTQVRNGDLRP